MQHLRIANENTPSPGSSAHFIEMYMFAYSGIFSFIVNENTLAGLVHSQSDLDLLPCSEVLDLFLIVDSSGSLSDTDFQEAKDAMSRIVENLDIEENRVLVTLINYSKDVKVSTTFTLDSAQTKDNIKSEIQKLDQMKDSTSTGDALAKAQDLCSTQCRPFNQAVSRVAVVFTDGESNSGNIKAIPGAQLLKDEYVTIFTVGIGKINPTELQAIASPPVTENYLHITNYAELMKKVNFIRRKLCLTPAFVSTKKKFHGTVKQGQYRFYKLDVSKLVNGGTVEIDFVDTKGKTVVRWSYIVQI
ncbi:unnamed protein product [Didymodactylos carnosus]|uniref:VWFA domain-containing protein n=1 Tax=Didymodactylos carnosus TaxID=1234261 RepID=A0A815BBP1_9BILA|nr:unnamed protein product [Didymodactylos carnosus]CAF4057776.1 unnamed protein product [Didymodactylos carnosus]